MIANIVLGMLLVWFTCVLVITVRAGADRREQDALASSHARHRVPVVEEGAVSALAAVETAPAQPETPDVVSASLTI